MLPFCIKAQDVLYSTKPIDFNNYISHSNEKEKNKIVKFSYSAGVDPLGLAFSLNRDNVLRNKNLNTEQFSLGLDFSTSGNNTYFFSWGFRYDFYNYVADFAPYYIDIMPDITGLHRSSINIQYLSLYFGNDLYFNKTNLSFGVMAGLRIYNNIKTQYTVEDIIGETDYNYSERHTSLTKIFKLSAEIYYGLPNIGLYFQYRINNIYKDDPYGNIVTSPFILGVRYTGLTNN